MSFSLLKVNAQTSITYTYDSNGNRTKRELDAKKSDIVSFPVKEQDIKPLEKLTEFEEGIKIYPNPTSGIIRVSLENFEDPIEGNLIIYNLSGIVLRQVKINAPFTEVDVNEIPDGIYVMRLFLNGKSLDYKIIKHNK
jgi:hypothetical protein